KRIALALAVLSLTSFINLHGQSSSDSRRKALPEFDVRDSAPATSLDARQLQSRAISESRRAGLASFAASPAESKLGTRIVPNPFGLPKLYLRDGHSLTAPSTLKAEDIARGFLQNQSSIFLLDGSEVANLRMLVDDVTDSARFLSFNQ